MTDAETAALVKGFLHDIGYKAEMMDDDSVGSAASGLNFYIQCYEDNVQFRCLLSSPDESYDWYRFANTFNEDLRFVKIYFTENEGLVVEADWWLDLNEANHIERFQRAMGFWELSLAAFKERFRQYKPPEPPQIDEAK